MRFCECREATITRHYHGLEKGLSFPCTRSNFGKKKIISLCEKLDQFARQHDYRASIAFSNAVNALEGYRGFHKEKSLQIDERIGKTIEKYRDCLIPNEPCVNTFTRDYLLNAAKQDYSVLSQNRYSIRDYLPIDVDEELIRQAICIAQKSPSACNRQSPRVYIVKDKEKILQLQKYKPGLVGFGPFPVLLIVTFDLRAIDLVQERSQGYIDAGIFSMSLLHALQFLGLACCPLHASFRPSTDRRVRKLFRIQENENLALMLSVGHMPETVCTPRSRRYSIDDIVRVV
jgi:nitroreductase